MKPRVSILIPVYKAEKYISKCLQSVLSQTYQNLEIIIVDDASPDSSMDIAEKLIQQTVNTFDIKILHNEKNQGIATVRNILLDHAKGDFILFVDSDDYIERDAIQSLVDIATNTNCDIVRCGYFEAKGNNIRTINQRPWSDKTDLLKQHIKAWDSIEAMWQLFIRRSLIENHRIRFAEGINASEDHLMMIKLYFYANSIVNMEKPVYYYRIDNTQSVTHVNPKAFHDSMYKGMDNAINFLKENRAYETYRDEVLTRTFLTKQTFLLNKENRDIDLFVNTHPECNSYYRNYNYNLSQKILFRLAELGQCRLLKLLTLFT
jgi:glycosyltransferase involved in cell wall biosynthesis